MRAQTINEQIQFLFEGLFAKFLLVEKFFKKVRLDFWISLSNWKIETSMIAIRRKERIEDETKVIRKHIELPNDVLEKLNTIVDMCEAVYTGMRKGFSESVYEEALCVELQERNIQYTHQETLPCLYKDRFVGNIRLDVILHSWLPFIFELKAIGSNIQAEERWQLVRYMSRKHVLYGAVVNFSQSLTKGLEISFVVKQEDGYYVFNLETEEGKLMLDA